MAAGGVDKKVTVYDLVSRAMIHEFKHDDYVLSISFSPDSKYIAAGGKIEAIESKYKLTAADKKELNGQIRTETTSGDTKTSK